MRLRELLRPPPHRGPLIAAGAVPLAVGIALEELKLSGSLPLAAHALILLAAGALIYWLGVQAPNEDGVPPAYQSVLLVTGIALLFAGLLVTANVLGATFGDSVPAGALVWTTAVAGALALWPAFERNSAISLLLAAILGGIGLLSLWGWVVGSGSPAPYRWLLALYAAALVLCALALRAPARRHAEVLIDAAGLAIAAIAIAPPSPETVFGGLPGWWELVLLGAGFGLVAFGAVDRSPGPAYLGVLNLVLFIAQAGSDDSPLWPLLLIAAGAAMLAAGLRPRRPLPPEPDPYRAGETPLAARAEPDEIVIRVRDEGR